MSEHFFGTAAEVAREMQRALLARGWGHGGGQEEEDGDQEGEGEREEPVKIGVGRVHQIVARSRVSHRRRVARWR